MRILRVADFTLFRYLSLFVLLFIRSRTSTSQNSSSLSIALIHFSLPYRSPLPFYPRSLRTVDVLPAARLFAQAGRRPGSDDLFSPPRTYERLRIVTEPALLLLSGRPISCDLVTGLPLKAVFSVFLSSVSRLVHSLLPPTVLGFHSIRFVPLFLEAVEPKFYRGVAPARSLFVVDFYTVRLHCIFVKLDCFRAPDWSTFCFLFGAARLPACTFSDLTC